MNSEVDFNELKTTVYMNARKHGWHDKELSAEHWAMMVLTELSEVIEADRMNRHARTKQFKEDMDYGLRELKLTGDDFNKYRNTDFDLLIKDTVEDELADVVIRLLDMAGVLGIDLKALDFYKEDIAVMNKDNMCAGLTLTEWCFFVTSLWTDKSFGTKKRRIEFFIFSCFVRAHVKNFDLMWHVKEKILYNSSRAYKHGDKAY